MIKPVSIWQILIMSFLFGSAWGCYTHLPNMPKHVFIDNIEAIYEGSFNASLLEDNSHLHAIVKSLKTVAIKNVFSNKEVEQLELQGYKITSSILNEYQRVLDLDADDFHAALNGEHSFAIESRLINRISKKVCCGIPRDHSAA